MSPGEHDILAMCRDEGFALAGVCAARPSDHADSFREWLESGQHGSMDYLARNVEERLDPSVMLPGAKSLIMVADQYARRGDTDTKPSPTNTDPAPAGRIARYAQGRDYHVVMKKRLHRLCDALREAHPDEQFRAFVDTAPVLEREHAARAGLGWIGKHTLLIHPTLGSWLLLGGILTTLKLDESNTTPITDHCGGCTRCIDACPTDAITPYSVHASKCISYLTIERREPIDPSFNESIGDWLFGCDVCQEVCPHNSERPDTIDTGTPNEAYAPRRTGFNVLEVLDWSVEDRQRAFQTSALKRATLDMFKRNAAIVLENHRSTTSESDPG